MSEQTQTHSHMHSIDTIEAIRQLKYRYFRFLDCKQWGELTDCFTEDASVAYDSGKLSYQGRDAIMDFLREGLGSADIISMHHGHHPEIALRSPTEADGTWYLEDYLIFKGNGMRLRGAAFYTDRYVKQGDVWRIEHTGYVRSFEEVHDGTPGAAWQVTSSGNHLSGS